MSDASAAVPGDQHASGHPRHATLDLVPVDGLSAGVHGRAVHDAARLRGRRGPDLDQRRSRAARDRSVHTIRDVGSVSAALAQRRPGTVLGVRGPFGTGWEVGSGRGGDVVFVAGGIGLAPLRPADPRGAVRRAATTGAWRSCTAHERPDDLLFADDLRALGRRPRHRRRGHRRQRRKLAGAATSDWSPS